MGKRSRSGKKEGKVTKRRARDEDVASEEMDDEIDAFHRQRDVVPLSTRGGDEDSDDDAEEPVFDFEGTDNEDNEEDDDMDDDAHMSGLAAKIVRQQKFLRAKIGGVEDETLEEEDKEDRVVWARRKGQFYDADQAASSDEDLAAEEEAEVLRLQREKAKSLSIEDFGLEDISEDESDREPTLGEIAARGDSKVDSITRKDTDDDDAGAFEEVKKDLNALTKEEQMDVVYSSAPELVGLLSELNGAVEELENRVGPLLSKVKVGENTMKEGVCYLEMKQSLLQLYCLEITFYLLRKSEGQSVRDHPVIGRLVEIKNLWDKVKEIDQNLASGLDRILEENNKPETVSNNLHESPVHDFSKDVNLPVTNGESRDVANAEEIVKLARLEIMGSKDKRDEPIAENGQLDTLSMKMLKVRAVREEKLRQKGVLSLAHSKVENNRKRQRPVNGLLETPDDFDDDVAGNVGSDHGLNDGHPSLSQSRALSILASAKQNKPKAISGDYDLPKRDDIGERRNKFERRVLQRAGVVSDDEADHDTGNLDANLESNSEGSGPEESEDDFYEQVKKERAAKLAAKAEKYSRTTAMLTSPKIADGKRLITYQMEKNRGLTRKRKKLTKNPRKKYRTKHEQALVRRKGQVREIRKPSGPYGGEASGINAGISRSIRFKS